MVWAKYSLFKCLDPLGLCSLLPSVDEQRFRGHPGYGLQGPCMVKGFSRP